MKMSEDGERERRWVDGLRARERDAGRERDGVRKKERDGGVWMTGVDGVWRRPLPVAFSDLEILVVGFWGGWAGWEVGTEKCARAKSTYFVCVYIYAAVGFPGFTRCRPVARPGNQFTPAFDPHPTEQPVQNRPKPFGSGRTRGLSGIMISPNTKYGWNDDTEMDVV